MIQYPSTDPTIAQVVLRSHALSKEKGWYDTGSVNIPEKLALIHSEVSEALEAYRSAPTSWITTYGEGGKPEGFGPELADVVIRLADLCGYLGLDLGALIVEKHAFNATRPHRHGGKAC